MPARNEMVKNSNDLKPGIYVGAGVSALLLLLPYVNLVFLPAYVLGPLAGVWFELRRVNSASISHREQGWGFTARFTSPSQPLLSQSGRSAFLARTTLAFRKHLSAATAASQQGAGQRFSKRLVCLDDRDSYYRYFSLARLVCLRKCDTPKRFRFLNAE